MRFRAVALAALALVTLSGCGGGGDDGSAKGSTVTDCTKGFSRADAMTLAAVNLGQAQPEPFSGLTACRWSTASGTAWVQVLAVPASQWATILPDAIGTVLDSDAEFSGRDKLEAARSLIEKGGKLSDSAACGIFSTMVSSLQGQPAGTTKVYNYIPNDSAPQGINGQACLGGRFYSVQLIGPGFQRGAGIEARIKTALDRAISG